MLPKRWVLGIGAIALFLGSLFGVACDDDEDDNGNGEPEATEPIEDTGDEEPDIIETPE